MIKKIQELIIFFIKAEVKLTQILTHFRLNAN